MAEIGKDLIKASIVLSNNEVLAIPTETVYGLAANALNAEAVAKIYEVKNRPSYNPLIIHLASKTELTKYVKDIPPIALKLAEKFWPGPLTLLLPRLAIIPDIVTSSLPNVAVRVPAHSLTLELLKRLPFPLAAPSANPFGYISPTRPEHVQRQIGNKIPYILDGGICSEGVESTIVGFNGNTAVIYRLGAISEEQIAEVAGEVQLLVKEAKKVESPGMLPYHYSPTTPLYLTDEVASFLESIETRNVGLIAFDTRLDVLSANQQIILSKKADLREAAHNLYNALHEFDQRGFDAIIAEKLPDIGLGKTINDRLERAAYKKGVV